ncbi:MAG TPA: hypothetical protein VLR50_10755 [Desulfobacterales bacterium]|nr:hypothetical protein [Desulfobacterales bacterium]
MALLAIATEHVFSAKLRPGTAAKIPLASRHRRVIFARQLGDDMAEYKQEKQGMASASFFLQPPCCRKNIFIFNCCSAFSRSYQR